MGPFEAMSVHPWSALLGFGVGLVIVGLMWMRDRA